MPSSLAPFAMVAAFAIGFPLFFAGVVYLVSRLSGWKSLAERFPAAGPPQGEPCTWASARLRYIAGYNRSLIVHVSARGIHMQPMLLFRTGHEPVFIPWEAVEEVRERGLSLFPAVDVRISGAGGSGPLSIAFHGHRVAETILRYWSGRPAANSVESDGR
ncbi:MAG: hypothetical protein AB7F96_09355 [Beijerinckiaceae bacterium]